MTAYAMKGDRDRCFAAGMDGQLSKPISAQRPYQTMEEVMNQPFAKELADRRAEEMMPFNLELALSRVEGDEELLSELARLFLAELPGMLEKLRAAVREKSPQAIASEAHTLKGAVANFGAARATDTAYRIERMGREEHLNSADDALRELENSLDLLANALVEVVKEPAMSQS
jgi:two-component system, sensor histidine kinase and response regulator